MSDHEMNTLPGKIPIKTIIRGMHSPNFFLGKEKLLISPKISFKGEIYN